jgi:flagellin
MCYRYCGFSHVGRNRRRASQNLIGHPRKGVTRYVPDRKPVRQRTLRRLRKGLRRAAQRHAGDTGDAAMTSINTNTGALLAQRYLREIDAQLTITQKRLSSGLRVSTVTDDASTYAVAAGLRADIKAYSAVSASLQGSTATAQVAVAAGESVSARLGDIKAKIVALSDGSLTTAARTAYNEDLAAMVSEVNSYLSQASFQGTNLLGTGGADVSVVANIDGSTLTLRNNDVENLSIGTISNNGQATVALGDLEDFTAALNTALTRLGADLNRVTQQTEFLRRTEETVRIGLGALVDADIAQETSYFDSLQARQQLAVQALGIANQQPQVLIGLFRS